MSQGSINRPKTAVPDYISFVSMKNAGARARSFYSEIIPDNDSSLTSTSGNVEYVFKIPSQTGQNTYLDPSMSYLTFQLVVANNAGGFCSSASDIIQRLQVEQGGNVVEDVQYYNRLHAFLLDVGVGADASSTFYNCTAGTGQSTSSTIAAQADVTALGAAPTQANVDAAFDEVDAIVDNIEASINATYANNRKGEQFAAGTTVQVAVSLVSVLGSLGEKYIPLSRLSSDLILRLTMESFATAFEGTAVADFTCSNFRYVASMIRLDNAIDEQLNASVGGVYTGHGTTYEHHRDTLATGNQSASQQVPFRKSSLKSIYLLPHRQTNLITQNNVNNRVLDTMKQYQFSIDGELVPQTPIDCNNGQGQALMELMKSFHALSSANPQMRINRTNYGQDNDGTGNGSTLGSFAVGLELENYANKDQILNGVNTITSSIFCNLDYTGNTTIAVNLDYYGYSDILYVIENGQMTRRT